MRIYARFAKDFPDFDPSLSTDNPQDYAADLYVMIVDKYNMLGRDAFYGLYVVLAPKMFEVLLIQDKVNWAP